ncbi:hypothetical protein GCM10010259_08760 [Streptomyces daghestanicus]|uniref:Uncharacterized protein n=1 Tax=Streptomyces daghestanicus TaxID=66885 RepID=A0ABQ3Q2Q2_9ACTN|nr:hypothetical protein GCM10010259_08760 [Streptomyces daghestanicus]GHI31568.1 hypothetical protein Sdagh_32980 [Streptomyces daghestanicus]
MVSFGVLARRLRDLWGERSGIDWLAAGALLLIHLSYCRATNTEALFSSITPDRRKDIYTTAASASALIGGFGTAAISQYATASGRRMLEIRRRFGTSLRRNWSGILSSMLVITAVCLLALIFDTAKNPGLTGWLVEAALLLGTLRAVRLVWLFGMLIDVADQDVTEPRRSPAVTIPRTRRPGDGDQRNSSNSN